MKLHCLQITIYHTCIIFSLIGVEIIDLYFAVMMKRFVYLVTLIYFLDQILLIIRFCLLNKSANISGSSY